MPQYKVEYRECPEGVLLKSSHITASAVEDAETAVKRDFTAVQANLGARQYAILDEAGVVVASHHSSDEPTLVRQLDVAFVPSEPKTVAEHAAVGVSLIDSAPDLLGKDV